MTIGSARRSTESIQVAVNGEAKNTKQMSCRYGPDGKPQCNPLGPPPPQQRGLRGRIAEKKKEEFTDFSMAAKKLSGLSVNSYLGDPSSPVTLNVQFAPLSQLCRQTASTAPRNDFGSIAGKR